MWIVIIVIAVIIIASAIRRQQLRQAQLNAQNQYNQTNTTGAGLIGQIGGLFGGGESNTNYSENEAKEISKQIADLLEGSPQQQSTANQLIADLEANGWKYEGYNMVSQLLS